MLACRERRIRRLRPQMPHQLLFQRSARLNEQAAINRFVRHAQALVVRVCCLQPSGNLLRRPVLHQFTRNDLCSLLWVASRHGLGRRADSQAC